MTTTVEPDDELGWVLAAEFDRVARDVRCEPDSGLLEALIDHGNDETVGALLDALDELCHGSEEAVARHYAEHLDSLAQLLDDDGGRAVRAVVDLRLGWLCTAPGSWPEARLRLSGPDRT